MSNQRPVAILVIVGLLAAAWVAARRWRDELAHRSVSLVADYQEIESLAAFGGVTVDTALDRLKAAGLTAVAVEEPTLGELIDDGLLAVEPAAGGSELRGSFASLQAQLALAHLQQRIPGRRTADGLLLPFGVGALRELGVGLDKQAFERIGRHGLQRVARLRNSPGLSPDGIVAAVREASAYGATVVIFSGDQVLGYPEELATTARAFLQSPQVAWGRVEFGQQKGEQGLAERLLAATPGPAPTYLRVHSITVAEMAKLAPELAIERYRRAAEERNIRVLFVRLLLAPSADIVARNERFVAGVAGAVQQAGLTLGEPSHLAQRRVSTPLLLTIAVLAVMLPAAWLIALLNGELDPRRLVRWAVGLGLLSVPAALLKPDLFAAGAALLAGLVYPIAAGRWALLRLSDADRPPGRRAAVGLLWGAVGGAVLGGLVVVGLLSDTSTMLHHTQFRGMKLTQLGPLLAAGLMLAGGLSLPGVTLAEARRRLTDFWRQPVRVQHVVLSLAALLALVILLLRGGNEGTEVSATELKLRAILETTLGARPRFKEMLLGHPAMLLTALAAARGRRDAVPVLFVVGMVGVVSTFNTFCHIHTPLGQSVLRTVHALWIGTLLGWLLDWGWRRLEHRRDG